MKFRDLFMTAVFFIAILISFSSQGTGKIRNESAVYKIGTNCIGGVTNQAICAVTGTGPVCTVGVANYTAYEVELPVCTRVLREPF